MSTTGIHEQASTVIFKVCNTVVAFHIEARAEVTGICKGTQAHQLKVTNRLSRSIQSPYVLQRQRGYERRLCNLAIQGSFLHQLSQVHREAPGPWLCEKRVLHGGLLWKPETHAVQSAIPQVSTKGCSWAEKEKVPNRATGGKEAERRDCLLGLGLYLCAT